MSTRRASSISADDNFRVVGQLVLLVAAARLVAAYLMPADGDTAPWDQLVASTLLLVAHGVVYLFGARMRAASGTATYVVVQGTLVLAIGMFSLSLWLTIALVASLAVQTFSFVRQQLRRGRK
jgi:hypothetical protein